MMTVKKVSELTGVSVRTLQYYDSIGLLEPAEHTEAGYRLYDDAALERLEQIMLFRELEFPLKEIRTIMSDPCFDRKKALEQQIKLLEMKRERLGRIIDLARGIKMMGVRAVDFTAFDNEKINGYKKRAREQWGNTDAYREFGEKDALRSPQQNEAVMESFMKVFAEFSAIKDKAPDSPEARAMVEKLKAFITEHFYNCTDEILSGLGKMYAADGEFRENIDAAAGKGTAVFASAAIAAYCG